MACFHCRILSPDTFPAGLWRVRWVWLAAIVKRNTFTPVSPKLMRKFFLDNK